MVSSKYRRCTPSLFATPQGAKLKSCDLTIRALPYGWCIKYQAGSTQRKRDNPLSDCKSEGRARRRVSASLIDGDMLVTESPADVIGLFMALTKCRCLFFL